MFEIKKHVAGTEGTHNYVVIAEGKRGLVAVRIVNSNYIRIRVEPRDEESAMVMSSSLWSINWKQPGEGGQNRFSCVTTGGAGLHNAVATAVTAVALESKQNAVGQEDWEGALAAILMLGSTEREDLIKRVRANDVAGAAAAGRWTTTTLLAKLVAATPGAERKALIDRLRQVKVAGANLASNWSLGTLRKKAVLAL